MGGDVFRARWDGGALRLMSNRAPELNDGEVVMVSIDRERSEKSHRQQFAWVNDAWMNLLEDVQGQPWAQTPETLRKHALIATGYHQFYTLDCGGKAPAQRVKAALVAAEAKAHGYAVGRINGPVVQVWTPESQSYRAMGRERFQESKTAILEWIAARVGVAPGALIQNAGGGGMTNLARKEPLGPKLKRPPRSPQHLARVKALPCVICHAPPPSDAHHCFHDRFGTRKASDFETIPLCKRHHQVGPDAIHNGKKTWREKYGADHEFLPVVADMLAGEWTG